MAEHYSESPIRKVLRSEITWTITTIALVMGFVKTVVIPINNLQIQVAQINTQLLAEQQKYTMISEQLKSISDQSIKTETRLNEHLKSK